MTRAEEKADWVDRMLQQQHGDYIEDDGFTAQLMQRLPPVKPVPHWAESIILMMAAVLSSVVAMWFLPGSHELIEYLRTVFVSNSGLMLAIMVLAILLGASAAAWWIAEVAD